VVGSKKRYDAMLSSCSGLKLWGVFCYFNGFPHDAETVNSNVGYDFFYIRIRTSEKAPKSLTLKISIAMFAETLENL
jgi:hypothetical protein